MNTTPPRSRRRCTQPMMSAVLPASEARSSPQVCVRRSSPKKSRGTDSIFVFNVPRELFATERDLLARGHVLQLICSRSDLVISKNERESRARFIGDFKRAFQFAIRRPLDRNSSGAQLRGQSARMQLRRI